MTTQSPFFKHIQQEKVLDPAVVETLRLLPDHQIFQILRDQYNLPEDQLVDWARQHHPDILPSTTHLFPDNQLHTKFESGLYRQHRFYPIYETEDALCIVLDNPFNPICDILEKQFQKPIQKIPISVLKLEDYLDGTLSKEPASILNTIIEAAIHKQASDIHIFKLNQKTQVKFRLHGQLYAFQAYTGKEESQLHSLIKFHAQMDISVVTQPQDGRLHMTYRGNEYDIRVASLPTVYGEDFVLRIFNQSGTSFQIESLGLSPKIETQFREMLKQPNGLILVTGPTGSGKTTTLYAALSHLLQTQNKTIVTLEDPVESILEGVRQSQINPKIGYDFGKGLKAVLRQDPDIIMIGEIRDQQTAQIAIEAAYTGHLVLSTLHTGDCESTLMRLSTFDLDPFLVGHALRGIFSQRLVRKLCPECKQKGCAPCHYTGFQGRILLTESLSCVTKTPSREALNDPKQFIKEADYISFQEDIETKVQSGLLSPHDAF